MSTQKIREILSKMTLEEKVRMLAQNDGRYGKCERLGLPGINPQDNPRGGADYFRSSMGHSGDGDDHPVSFPSASAIAQSFDDDLTESVGRHMGEAAKKAKKYVHVLNRPGCNIKRSPLNGRNFEYFSEDPYLSGSMAGAYIRGVQSTGVSACLKHYIANNQEYERMTTDAVMDERTFREIYLRVFETAIRKGNPWMIMTSYNKLNGDWVNSNEKAMKALREDLHYDGVVVSDFLAIHENKVAAHKNGVDIELAPDTLHSDELFEAVRKGEISEEQIDRSVARILTLCDRLLENEKHAKPVTSDPENEHHAAQKAAEECMVMLENDGTLPLSKDTDRILVVGELAVCPSTMGGGSGHMNGYRIDKPLDEIRAVCKKTVDYVAGYHFEEVYPPRDVIDDGRIRGAVEQARKHDVVLFFGGYGYCTEAEGFDRSDILLPESQRKLLKAIMAVNDHVILILTSGSAIDLHEYKDDVAGLLYTAYAGEGYGKACADVLFGEAEPGGRLAETFPMCLEQTPAYLSFTTGQTDEPVNLYGEGVFVGYRWYDARKLPVAYPFGYGLSYTNFNVSNFRIEGVDEPSDFKISANDLKRDGTMTVSAVVTNTGRQTGSEVLQLYVSDEKSTCRRPQKELKAYAKVTLAPGESRTVTMTLDRHAFEFYSNNRKQWILENGKFTLILAENAQKTLGRISFTLTDGDTAFLYQKMTALVWFLKDPYFKKIISRDYPYLQDFFNPEKTEFLILLYAVPFYKLAQPLMGKSMFTDEQINKIIDEMNQRQE
jgi:beta-glucosidase